MLVNSVDIIWDECRIQFFNLFFLFEQSLMKAVYETPLHQHLLSCFFLLFVPLLSYLSRFDFLFQDLFAVFVQL